MRVLCIKACSSLFSIADRFILETGSGALLILSPECEQMLAGSDGEKGVCPFCVNPAIAVEGCILEMRWAKADPLAKKGGDE